MNFSIPTDAITLGYYTETQEVYTLLNNNDLITIVTIGMANSGQSTAIIYCGNDVISTNVKGSTGVTPVNIQCDDDITFQTLQNGESSTIINYVPYDLREVATSTESYNPATSISSSTDITIYGAMSAGEILISFIMLLILFVFLLFLLIKSLGEIKTKKRYIEYSNGDVPINEQL